MRKFFSILFILFSYSFLKAQTAKPGEPDCRWGNAMYFNMNAGDSIRFNEKVIRLLEVKSHGCRVKIGNDSLWLTLSRRTLPLVAGNIRIFLADNRNIRAAVQNQATHSLLKKEALICISDFQQPLLDPQQYVFPVSFNDGFVWNTEDANPLFSFQVKTNPSGMKWVETQDGINFDLTGARGLEKHWLVAMENSTVVWIKPENDKAVAVLLQSRSNSKIFYCYRGLYNRTLEVREGQNLLRGELIGTGWGNETRCFVRFSVVYADTIPSGPENLPVLNFFPQLFERCFNHSLSLSRSFVKGNIKFGKNPGSNLLAFEEYSGRGWILGAWNPAARVEAASNGIQANARLNSVMFPGTSIECRNPQEWFDYEINVRNGAYRVRAKVGDAGKASWQKLVFEGVAAGTYSLDKNEFRWSPERIVKVTDGKLTLRFFVEETGSVPAGISEIVFQRAD